MLVLQHNKPHEYRLQSTEDDVKNRVCMAKPSSGVGRDQRGVAVQDPKPELSDDDNFRPNYGYQCVATFGSKRVGNDIRNTL
jgi:hypothetical protein